MAEALTMLTSVRLPNEVLAELKEMAKEEHRSISNYIAEIVSDFLEDRKDDCEPDAETWKDIEKAREELRNGTCIVCRTKEERLRHLESL